MITYAFADKGDLTQVRLWCVRLAKNKYEVINGLWYYPDPDVPEGVLVWKGTVPDEHQRGMRGYNDAIIWINKEIAEGRGL